MRDQSSTSPFAFATIAFLLCLLADGLLFHQCIGTTVSIYGRDTVSHDYGMALWCWNAVWSSHRLPLWNPYLFGGIPTLGSFAFNPFNLQSLPFFVLPFPLAYTLQYLLAFALGGTGMALLLRRIGCSCWAALTIAIVFALSGHFTTLAHAGHLTKAVAFGWVPWLFYLAERWWERLTWRRAAAMSIPLALMITASHLQITYLAGGFLLVWLVGQFASCVRVRPCASVFVRVIPQLAFSLAFAAALSAAQLLPGLEMAGISNRAEGVTYQEAARTSYPPVELLEYVIPGWIGSSAPHAYAPYRGTWGKEMAERIVSDYFGIVALGLALLGLLSVKDRRKWIWFAIAGLGVLIGLGAYTPFWRVLRFLPGFASFRSPAVAMGWTTIGLLVLAAMGLDCLRQTRRSLVAPIVLFILFFALLFVGGFMPHWLPDDIALGHALRWACCVSSLGCLTGAAIFLSGRNGTNTDEHGPTRTDTDEHGPTLPSPQAGRKERRRPCRSVSVRVRPCLSVFVRVSPYLMLSLVLIGDVFVRSGDYVAPLDNNNFMAYLQTSTPPIVRDDPSKPVRILQKGEELTNAFMASGVGSIHGYHPITFHWYDLLIRRLGFFNPVLAAMLHQNWLLLPPNEPAGSAWKLLGNTGQRGWLYERNPPTPYVFFPQKIQTVDTLAQALDVLTKPGFDPAKTAVVEPATMQPLPDENNRTFAILPSFEGHSEVHSYGLDSAFVDVDANQPGVVVFADLWAPGWEAETFDRWGSVLRADAGLRAAIVPAGENLIIWRYDPFSFRLGLFISLVALGALGGSFWRKARTPSTGSGQANTD